nr:class I SAM-dependent methyltransferase [uncultured Actinoplanes sp.]
MTDVATTALPADWQGTAPSPLGVDEAFNGYVAAQVVFAFDRLGLLDRLAGEEALEVAALDGDQGVLAALVRAAEAYGYLTATGGWIRLTPAGREMAAMRGYFTWSVGGYRDVFAGAAELAAGRSRFGHEITRDEAMVALGSGQNDRSFMAPTLDDVLAGIDFGTIADLGSGVCARVSRVVAGRPGTRGVGLDISAPATELAERTIGDAGLTGRVRAVRADVLDVLDRGTSAELAEVDTVMSFFLMHDLLADPGRRPSVLPRLREAFPAATTFVLADTMVRPVTAQTRTVPVFSVGYELAHALMGIPLHSRETYEGLFAAAGLRTARVLPFGTPHSWLYVLHTD